MRKGMAVNRSNGKTVSEILGRSSVHPFPARMAPDIALGAVAGSKKPLRVLDPMSGSGTVLAVARANGHRAIGVDRDPLAVLISKVWTTAIDTGILKKEAAKVLKDARKTCARLSEGNAYPESSDDETRQFIEYWFDSDARRQLVSLAIAIEAVDGKNIRDALWCAFSRLIITKKSGASLAMDLSHSRPHKAFKRAPAEPFRTFSFAVERVAHGCINSNHKSIGCSVRVHEGDARSLALDDCSVDLVLTSPPYLNAIDYLRCSKFSLVWMGYTVEEIRRIRSTSVGTMVGKYEDGYARDIISKINLKPALGRNQEAILTRYVDDMQHIVRETARVLTYGGRTVYVIGENTMRGTFIRNSRIVKELANDVGLRLVSRRARKLPANRRYLPPPSKHTTALDGRMRQEVVLTLEKV